MKKKKMVKYAPILLTSGMLLTNTAIPFANGVRVVYAVETNNEKVWDFSTGLEGWVYDDSWKGDANVTGSCSYDAIGKRLQVDVDYSLEQSNGWCQTGISISPEGGINYSSYNTLSLDLYYDTDAFTTGQITVKVDSGSAFKDQMAGINSVESEVVEGNIKKATFTFQIADKNAVSDKLLLLLVGNSTDYKGSLWIDNIRLYQVDETKDYIDVTQQVQTETSISETEDTLIVNVESIAYPNEVSLVDANADETTVATYQYLKAVGQSKGTIYGHMEDTVLKAGNSQLSNSDTKDITGSISGIVGLDCGNLFDGFADKYNKQYGGTIPSTIEGNIKAAALISNEAIKEGAIMTLSAHMPNFVFATEKNTDSNKSYDKYDFLKADSYNLDGDCMNQILPGGKYHDQFNAYLDMVAEYASQVDGTILFRPFHENTGSWFWWGKAFCEPETYKSVFKYTVEYLRDKKDIHNLIYVYGPGSEAANLSEYEERYPGDGYVDMVGFDTYDSNPTTDEEGYKFQQNFENTVKLTNEFATKHNKLFAVTETGITSDKGGLPLTGNKRLEWFQEMLDIVTKEEYNCSYFMIWTNYSDSSFYTPFIHSVLQDGSKKGHEMTNEFIKFYNDKKSIFASDQKDILQNLLPKKPTITDNNIVSGYITSPVAGSRILDETVISAQLSKENVNARFVLVGNENKEIELETIVNKKQATAKITKEVLSQLGETVNGKICLYADNELLQEIPVIFNVKETVKDALTVDDFEFYYGESALLNRNWAVNKDSGCELNLSLSNDYLFDGEYSLKFEYKETKTGWAGATVKNEADWSSCNGLQFWVLSDNKNQKTVVQINTSDGGSYEAYLNNYEEFKNATGPILVTLPFSEFVDKGGRGELTSEKAADVSNFGLWVNAISDSPQIDENGMVEGVLYYDAIKAVSKDNIKPNFQNVYQIQIKESQNGICKISSKNQAEGEEVTLEITPEEGYGLKELKITDSNGEVIPYYTKEKNTTSYAFLMPSSNVDIVVEFNLLQENDDGNTEQDKEEGKEEDKIEQDKEEEGKEEDKIEQDKGEEEKEEDKIEQDKGEEEKEEDKIEQDKEEEKEEDKIEQDKEENTTEENQKENGENTSTGDRNSMKLYGLSLAFSGVLGVVIAFFTKKRS